MNPVIIDPSLVSMSCRVAKPGECYGWHTHPFSEFTFVTEDATEIGCASGKRPAQPNTLFLFHPGERHGAWNTPQQAPSYWVVHFTVGPPLYPVLDRLSEADPWRRAWQLTSDQSDAFKWLFLQTLNEQMQRRNHFLWAQSSWLQLLLLSAQRWATGEAPLLISRPAVHSQLLRLWQLVNASVENPPEMLNQIRLLRNYDSLRHGFRKAFGCSPREMMLQLRMQHARNLLLETGLSIKEIAARSGYLRQHEFARAFHRHVGLTPSEWRRNPFRARKEDSKTATKFSGTAKDGQLE